MNRIAPGRVRRGGGFSLSPETFKLLDAIVAKRLAKAGGVRPRRGGRRGMNRSAVVDDAVERQAALELTTDEIRQAVAGLT